MEQASVQQNKQNCQDYGFWRTTVQLQVWSHISLRQKIQNLKDFVAHPIVELDDLTVDLPTTIQEMPDNGPEVDTE